MVQRVAIGQGLESATREKRSRIPASSLIIIDYREIALFMPAVPLGPDDEAPPLRHQDVRRIARN